MSTPLDSIPNNPSNITTDPTLDPKYDGTKSIKPFSPNGITSTSYVEEGSLTNVYGSPNSVDKGSNSTIDRIMNEPAVQDLIKLCMQDSAFSDFDIRELMKLLIKAFLDLSNTQRTADLTHLMMKAKAFDEKISAMDEAAKEKYNAAIASVVGSIVSGALQTVGGGISFGFTMAGARKSQATIKNFSAEKGGSRTVLRSTTEALSRKYDGLAQIGNAVGHTSGMVQGFTGIASAKDTYDAQNAEIEQAKQEHLLELVNKALTDLKENKQSLVQFISSIMQTIQALIQSVNSTEKTIVQS